MRRIWLILPLVLLLTGCKSIADIKPDTIVDIPMHPTEVLFEAVTEMTVAPAEPAAETEPVAAATESTEPVTKPPKTNTKPSGGKKPSRGSTDNQSTATQLPTQPPTEAPTAPQPYDPSGYVPGSLDRTVANEINTRRQAEGLGGLRLDDRLCAIASVRAWETARTWNSARPDGSGGITVLAEYGCSYSAAGENLYFGPANAAGMVDKWMSSDSRRANILMEAADIIGVGTYTGADGTTFVAVLIVG